MGRNMTMRDFTKHVARFGGEVRINGAKLQILDPQGRVATMGHVPHRGNDGRYVEAWAKQSRRNGFDFTRGL